MKLSKGCELALPPSPHQELILTPAGKDVLSGKISGLETFEIDRWIGGVHLTPEKIWCWDAVAGEIVKTT